MQRMGQVIRLNADVVAEYKRRCAAGVGDAADCSVPRWLDALGGAPPLPGTEAAAAAAAALQRSSAVLAAAATASARSTPPPRAPPLPLPND